MRVQLVGRHSERRTLLEALQSPDAELVAVFGRRRVGKTFLIRQIYKDSIGFELVGMHDADVPQQLRVFATALGMGIRRSTGRRRLRTWRRS